MPEICKHKYTPSHHKGETKGGWCFHLVERSDHEQWAEVRHPCPYAHFVGNRGKLIGYGCDNYTVIAADNKVNRFGTTYEFSPKAYDEDYEDNIRRPVIIHDHQKYDCRQSQGSGHSEKENIPIPGIWIRIWRTIFRQ